MKTTSLSETSPQDYLMQRFDAIKEFVDVVTKFKEDGGSYGPSTAAFYWRTNRAEVYRYPVVHGACDKLEYILGMDDDFWTKGI